MKHKNGKQKQLLVSHYRSDIMSTRDFLPFNLLIIIIHKVVYNGIECIIYKSRLNVWNDVEKLLYGNSATTTSEKSHHFYLRNLIGMVFIKENDFDCYYWAVYSFSCCYCRCEVDYHACGPIRAEENTRKILTNNNSSFNCFCFIRT